MSVYFRLRRTFSRAVMVSLSARLGTYELAISVVGFLTPPIAPRCQKPASGGSE